MPDNTPPSSPSQALRALVGYLSNHFTPEDAPALPAQLRGLLLTLGASEECAAQAWACVVDVLEAYRHTPEGHMPPPDEYRVSVVAQIVAEAGSPEEAERLRWFAAAPTSEVRMLASRAMAVAALRDVLAQLPEGATPTHEELAPLVARALGPSAVAFSLVEAEVALAIHALYPSEAALDVAAWLAAATPDNVRTVLSRAAFLSREPSHAQR